MWGVVIGILASLVLIRYAGLFNEIKNPAGFIVAGALFYLVDIAWTTGTFAQKIVSSAATWLTFVWELIAFLLIVIGALWAAVILITKS